MSNSRWILLATAGLTVSVKAVEIGLAEGWNLVRQGNHALEASRSRGDAAREARAATAGAWFPVVRLEASANHMDRDLVMDLDPIRAAMIELQSRDAASLAALQTSLGGGTLTPQQRAAVQAQAQGALDAALPRFRQTIKDQDHWTASVNVYQPLFHGGKILAANRQAAARRRAADADTTRLAADVRRDFARLYVQGALLRRSLSLREEALVSIARHVERADRMVEQGMADRSAALRARLAWTEATTALADDSARLATLELALAQIAGSEVPLRPTDALPPPPDLIDRDSSEPSAHPMLAALHAQRQAASGAVRAKAGEFAPEVGAFGRWELHREALSVLDPHWVVGVRGTWTVFRGGADAHAWKAARAQEAELAAMEREAASLVDLQDSRQFLSWRQASARWKRLQAQEDLAAENHRVAESRFRQGQGTSLEVVDAWLSLEKASLERLSASGDAWIAALETFWSRGQVERFAKLWNDGGAR